MYEADDSNYLLECIDEIDSIGMKRSSDNQAAALDTHATLNHLLTLMDGCVMLKVRI